MIGLESGISRARADDEDPRAVSAVDREVSLTKRSNSVMRIDQALFKHTECF